MAVDFSQENDIGCIELSQPDQLNPLDDRTWSGLSSLITELEHDANRSLRSLTITGAGRVFSAGGDINRMRAVLDSPQSESEFRESELTRLRWISAIVLRWVRLPIVRIAAVNRCAVGAGLALASSCDYRIVSDDGFFDTSFARLGLPGDTGISYFLPRLIGVQRAREWLIRPRRVYADEALSIGLVDEVVPAHELRQRARSAAADFAALSPVAMGWVRQLVDTERSLEHALELEAQATVACKGTTFHRSAVADFLNKRDAGTSTANANPPPPTST
jgi:2-(1,2-epoxy-1,2-dihydrophenyl)acetyl-CoA isomerase